MFFYLLKYTATFEFCTLLRKIFILRSFRRYETGKDARRTNRWLKHK